MAIEPTQQTLERHIRAVVAEGSGVASERVIPGRSNGPFPRVEDGVAATVTLILDTPEGSSFSIDSPHRPEGERLQLFRSSNVSYSVIFFYEGSADAAARFATWITSRTGTTALNGRGLVVYRAEGIRELSAVFREKWEDRHGLDVVFGVTRRLVPAVDRFDKADIDVHHSKDEGARTLQVEVDGSC